MACFEVVAGGRRLAALRLLAKDSVIASDLAVPVSFTTDERATEVSLTENVTREKMHDADMIDAFAALHDKEGMSPEAIADRFGISSMTVRRRLKLAAVSPKLKDLFRTGDLKLEQMMALAVTNDHAAQEAAYFEARPGWQREASRLREVLTKQKVSGSSAIAKYVTVEAYEAAGGTIEADLFATVDRGGFLNDSDLLNRLVYEKLSAAVEPVKAEGWLWVECMLSCEWQDLQSYERAYPEARPL